MAKSKAKKMREHAVRNGKRDVSLSRGINPDFSTHERKTKSLTDRKNKNWNKYGKSQLAKDTGKYEGRAS